MADAAGRGRGELPYAFGTFQKILPADGGFPAGQSRPLPRFLAENQDIFVDVPQGGIGGGLPAAPGRGGGGAVALVPDDFPPHQKAEGQEILDDVAVQRQIGAAAQVGNVETNPAAGRQDAIDFRHYLAQEVPVFVQGQVGVVLLAHIVGRGSDHQVDAGGGQGVHPRRRLGQDGIYGIGRQGIFPIGAGLGGGQVRIQPPAIERRSVMPLPPGRPEGGGAGFTPPQVGGGGTGRRLAPAGVGGCACVFDLSEVRFAAIWRRE